MASAYFNVSSMLARREKRSEPRYAPEPGTAVLEFRGDKHIVQVVNVSSSGAMVAFTLVPNIGERLTLQLLDRGAVTSQVRWVKDGRVGLSFP